MRSRNHYNVWKLKGIFFILSYHIAQYRKVSSYSIILSENLFIERSNNLIFWIKVCQLTLQWRPTSTARTVTVNTTRTVHSLSSSSWSKRVGSAQRPPDYGRTHSAADSRSQKTESADRERCCTGWEGERASLLRGTFSRELVSDVKSGRSDGW